MKKIFPLLACVACVLSFVAILLGIVSLTAKETKIGVVDAANFMNRIELVLSARNILNSEADAVAQDIEKWNSDIEKLKILTDYDKRNLELKSDLDKKNQEFTDFLVERRSELTEKEKEVFAPVYAIIDSIVEDYAQKKNIDLIVSATTAGNILYVTPKLNIVDDLVTYVNAEIAEIEKSLKK